MRALERERDRGIDKQEYVQLDTHTFLPPTAHALASDRSLFPSIYLFPLHSPDAPRFISELLLRTYPDHPAHVSRSKIHEHRMVLLYGWSLPSSLLPSLPAARTFMLSAQSACICLIMCVCVSFFLPLYVLTCHVSPSSLLVDAKTDAHPHAPTNSNKHTHSPCHHLPELNPPLCFLIG